MSKTIHLKTEIGVVDLPIDAVSVKGKDPMIGYNIQQSLWEGHINNVAIDCFTTTTTTERHLFSFVIKPATHIVAGIMTRDDKIFLDSVKGKLNAKQDTLVSGTNIATINNVSLLNGGNIDVSGFLNEMLRFRGLVHVDGTGYATSGYVYFTNDLNPAEQLLICYGTTGSIGGDDSNSSITFSVPFSGYPVITVQMVDKNNFSTSTGNIYRNAQFVRGFTRVAVPNQSAKTIGFNMDCGNNDPHYYSYIAIGKPRF